MAKLEKNAEYKAKKHLEKFTLHPKTRRLMAAGARAAAVKLKSRLSQAAEKLETHTAGVTHGACAGHLTDAHAESRRIKRIHPPGGLATAGRPGHFAARGATSPGWLSERLAR